MRISTLARRMARFRIENVAPEAHAMGETKNVKELMKYYIALIEADQVIPIFHRLNKKNAIIVALCEIYLIKESDIELMKQDPKKMPEHISDGDICWIANITISPEQNFKNTYHFYRTLLKMKYSDKKRVHYRSGKRGIFKSFKI